MSENAKRYAKPSTKTTTSGRSKTGSKEDGAKLSFNMTELRPLTDRQQDLFNAFSRDRNIIGYGSAGSGKSYLATYLAIKDILVNKNFKRLLILRSPLSVNHQGYLPGTLEEKEAVYERPYRDIVTDLFQNKEMYDKLKEEHIIDFQTTSYIRGLTWNDTIVVADEVQNMLWEEINTIATRIGTNSKLVFLGDLAQNDITVAKRNQHSGMEKLLMIAKRIDKFDLVKFLPEDIVRGEFVKQWIIACEQYEEQFTIEKTSSK